MRLLKCCGAAILASTLIGCGSSGGDAGSTPALPTPPDTSSWKQVDNLDYLSWRKVPVGTEVVRTSVTTVGENTTTTVERFTLKSATDTEVTVDRQNTTSRSDGSYHQANPPEGRKITARLIVHPQLDPADFLKPDRTAKAKGKEKLTALGREFECVKWEWVSSTDAGPMNVVSWLSDDMPGRIVKQEMTVPATKSVTVDQVTEWKKPN